MNRAHLLVPVHVLTGALGSGKTTLLNDALRAGLGSDTAIVVNEFGEIALDQLFIQARSDDMLVLQNGCVCCTIRTDLVSTLLELVARRPASAPLRRVVIECSGLSDPLPVLQTLRAEPALRTRFRVGSVVCAVAASDPDACAGRPEAVRQVTAADAIVLTQGDLAGGAAAEAACRTAAALNPLAQFVTKEGFALVQWLQRREEDPGDGHDAVTSRVASAPTAIVAHGVRSTVIRAASPASWPVFAVWLSRLVFLHGERILRTKGVLFDPGRNAWIAVHGVRKFFHPPVHLDLAEPPACGACLVFITEDLDPALITRSYARWVADPGASTSIARRASARHVLSQSTSRRQA